MDFLTINVPACLHHLPVDGQLHNLAKKHKAHKTFWGILEKLELQPDAIHFNPIAYRGETIQSEITKMRILDPC